MPIVVGVKSMIAKQFLDERKGHVKYHCYGAKDWEEPDDRPRCEVIYRIEGVPQSERNFNTLPNGWWCENCCRERGWIW